MKRQWVFISAGLFILLLLAHRKPNRMRQTYCSDDLWNLAGDDFEGFDNETGIQSGAYIVPNYVHFLRVGPDMKEFSFVDAVVVLSAFKNQKPETLFFHTDQEFRGHFWNVLVRTEGFMQIVRFVPTLIPDDIYGQKFKKDFHLFHAGDILRIRLLMKYGGMFLDNDAFLVRSLDVFRKFEMSIGWDEGDALGTQVLVAHKDARFLKLWQNSYKDHYVGPFWYYNAGERPTDVVLTVRPELVHRVQLLFGVHDLKRKLYQGMWYDWKKQYAIHLLIRHFKWLWSYPYRLPKEFTIDNIHDYPITFTAMVDSVFNYTLHESLKKGNTI